MGYQNWYCFLIAKFTWYRNKNVSNIFNQFKEAALGYKKGLLEESRNKEGCFSYRFWDVLSCFIGCTAFLREKCWNDWRRARKSYMFQLRCCLWSWSRTRLSFKIRNFDHRNRNKITIVLLFLSQLWNLEPQKCNFSVNMLSNFEELPKCENRSSTEHVRCRDRDE